MARTIQFEGRIITVPDDASESEIAEILQVPLVSSPQEKRGIGSEIGRQVGLTARAGLEGFGSVPQIIGSALESLGVPGAGVNVGKQISDVVGLPKPQTDIERVSQMAAQGMSSGFPFLKGGQMLASSPAASEVAQKVGSVMASQPAAQIGLSGVSGGATESAKVAGLGEGAQLAAGIAAPIVAAPIASSLAGTGRMIKDIVSPLTGEKAVERGAARLAVRATGPRAEQATTALGAASPDVTAGQAAAAIDNADLAALQKLANQRDASLSDLIQRGTKEKIRTAWGSLESRLAPVREEALALAEKGGVDPNPLINKVTLIANTRGNKTNPVIQSSMRDIFDNIRMAVDEKTGLADPVELDNVRKQIKNYIEKHSKESSQWDAKKTASLERQMQLAIDDAIDAAITKADPSKEGMWSKSYMSQYRDGANKIRAIEKNLEREIELATKGLPEVSKIVGDTENPIRGLNLLSRIASLTNFAVRAAEGSAGSAVEKKLAQMMASSDLGGDKRKLAELMRSEMNKPKTMLESMLYKPSATRAQLGYGLLSGD